MTAAHKVKSYLDQHRTQYELVAHPKTYSSRDTASAAHVPDDHIAKGVLVRDTRGHALVVLPGGSWVRLEALRAKTGRAFELAAEAEVDAVFADCQPGAVPALGAAYGLETYVDESLSSLANVYFEAGSHEELVKVSGEAFGELLRGARHGHFSHDE